MRKRQAKKNAKKRGKRNLFVMDELPSVNFGRRHVVLKSAAPTLVTQYLKDVAPGTVATIRTAMHRNLCCMDESTRTISQNRKL